MDNDDSTFDKIINRVRMMLAYSTAAEIAKILVAEGHEASAVYLAIVAASMV
jgi:hypothetical protein